MLAIMLSIEAGAAELGTEQPEHIVLGLAGDAQHALTWRTAPNVLGSVVELWPSDAPDTVQRVVGESEAWSTNLGDMRIHRAQIDGLQPNVTYGYRVGDGSQERWSSSNQFTAAPAKRNDSVSVLVLSDTQCHPGRYRVWGETLYWALADEHQDDLLVLTGDIVDYGGDQEEWEQWFGAVKNDALGRLPVLPVVGNHELSVGGRGKNQGENVLMQFQTPANGPQGQEGLVYSVDYGDVHIVVQNSEARSSADIAAQKRFLIDDLSQSKARWKVVFLHRPIYEAVRSWNTSYLEPYVPIWEQYGVDLVISGHDHVYMRTYPMHEGEAAENQPLNLSAGIVYITAGRAGSKGAPSGIYQPEQAARYQRLNGPNYVNLTFSHGEVRILARYTTWGVIDDVVLKKGAVGK